MKPSGPMDVFTLQAEREFRAWVRPIYRNSPIEHRPEQIGSCLLLNLHGTPTVLTAAHILQEVSLRECTLYVGGSVGAGLVPIFGGTRLATPGGRADHLDVGRWQPPNQAVDSLGAVEFLAESLIAPDSQAVSSFSPCPNRQILLRSFGNTRTACIEGISARCTCSKRYWLEMSKIGDFILRFFLSVS
jgi:hypothetical protein